MWFYIHLSVCVFYITHLYTKCVCKYIINSSYLQVWGLYMVLNAFPTSVLVNPVYFDSQKGPQENNSPRE